MSGHEDPVIQRIVALHSKDDFLGIISEFRNCACSKEKAKNFHLVTWPLPSEKDLKTFSKFIISQGIRTIYSVGCGSGLLEFLMTKFIEDGGGVVKMVGIEVDSKWWNSKYAPPKFIPLEFYGENFYIEKEGFGNACDLAIFCYFNNMNIFLEYLKSFNGTFVVLIGPISSSEQFCSPGPLELAKNEKELPTHEWTLISCEQFGFISIDHLAIYKRKKVIYEYPTQ